MHSPKRSRPTFIPRYLKILPYGGLASPEQILTGAGIDMWAPVFWPGGFDMIRGMVQQLEAL